MTVQIVLTSIQQYLQTKRVSKIEKKRLLADLNSVFTRLEKKDYQKFSHTRNQHDVPDRTREIFTEVEFYCLLGQTWAQILKPLNLKRTQTISDICPGFSPKIELGLYYLNFDGEITVLDKDAKAVTSLKKFLELFNPLFKVTNLNVDLFNYKGQKFDVVLANHVIDDLLMYYFTKKAGVSLDYIYETEGEYMKLWNSIIKNDKQNLDVIVPLLTEMFLKLSKKGGQVVIAQYKSYMEKLLDVQAVALFNRQVFKKLILNLQENGFKIQNELSRKAFTKKSKRHFGPSDIAILKRIV